MGVPAVGNSWANFFQTAGKVGAIGGAVFSATCVVLGQDYTYPCAFAALSACAWFSVWLNQTDGKTIKEVMKDQAYRLIDSVSDKAKGQLKGSTDKLVDLSIGSGKTASIASLPSGVGTVAGASLDLTRSSMQGLSTKSFEGAIDSTNGLVKRSVERSLQDHS